MSASALTASPSSRGGQRRKERLAGPSNSHNRCAEHRDTTEDTLKTLSRRCKYALRALYRLTREYQQGPVRIAQIAAKERIPRKFLEAILVQLRDRQIVGSREGKNGGYYLSAPPQTVTIGSVLRIIDGPLAPLPCASETAYQPCDECEDEARCETKFVMREVRNAIAGVLDNVTLAEVCAKDANSKAAGASLSDVV